MPWYVLPALLLNVAIIATVTKRVVGVPVGWPRTLLVAALYAVVGHAVLVAIGANLGVISTGSFAYLPGVPTPLALLVFVLLLAWGIGLSVGTLVVLEVLVPTGTLPDPLLLLRDLPARWRRQRRYTEIVSIAARRGLSGWLGAGAQAEVNDSRRVARALRTALSEGGVTFVKFGQMMSTRADLIGENFASELGRLTSEAPPEPWPRMREALEKHLGCPWQEVFADIDPAPLAAASVGQVHTARLQDGRPVVIKIQRPGATAQVGGDLDILRRMARSVEARTAWGRELGVVALVEGFANSLDEELDYRIEAANARAIAAGLADAGGDVRVPQIHEDLSGRHVLVMERIFGAPVSRASAELARVPAARRSELAEALLLVVLRQVVSDGVFHADLHSGNVLLVDGGHLALLDFGSVGRLDRSSREGISRLLAAVANDDAVAATDSLLMILDRPSDLDDRALERELGGLLVRLRHGGRASGAFRELFDLIIRHGFTVPGQVAAAFRSLVSLEGTLTTVAPGFDLGRAAENVGADLFTERISPRNVWSTLETKLLRAMPIVERLPRHIDNLGRRLEDGELTVRVRVLDSPEDRAFITSMVREVTMAIISAACAITAAVFFVAGPGPVLAPGFTLYPLLGATFLLFAFIIAARVLALALGRPAPPREQRRLRGGPR